MLKMLVGDKPMWGLFPEFNGVRLTAEIWWGPVPTSPYVPEALHSK